jgi:hypothetical protein
MPLRIGHVRAAELILLGDPFDAGRAAELGLVTDVVSDKDVLARATTLRPIVSFHSPDGWPIWVAETNAMDAEIIAQTNGLFPLQSRPKGLFQVAILLVRREDDRMRNPHIVRDTDERRGGAILCTGPTATALTQAKCDGGESMLPNGYHQPAGSAQSSLGSSGIAETGLHVDGFSIVVRVVPDGGSTKKPSDFGATYTDIQTILSSALEKIVDRFRGADPPSTNSSNPQPELLLSVAELVTLPQATPTEIVLRVGPWSSTFSSERPNVAIGRLSYSRESFGYCDT